MIGIVDGFVLGWGDYLALIVIIVVCLLLIRRV